jgi:hypothetical protein
MILHTKRIGIFFDTLPYNLLSNYSSLFIFHVFFQFGVQDQLAFKLTHMIHMTFNFDVPHMHEKLSR